MPLWVRRGLQIFGVALVATFAALLWYGQKPAPSLSVAQGEEVYASHDCTDCHLAASALAQKRDKKEMGLIRLRKDFTELVKFLETDTRHHSFTMISAEDRANLIEYLRTMQVP